MEMEYSLYCNSINVNLFTAYVLGPFLLVWFWFWFRFQCCSDNANFDFICFERKYEIGFRPLFVCFAIILIDSFGLWLVNYL